MPTDTVRDCLQRWLHGRSLEDYDREIVDFSIGCAAAWPGFRSTSQGWEWTGQGAPPRFLETIQAAELLVPDDCDLRITRTAGDVRVYRVVVQSSLDATRPDPVQMKSVLEAVALAALRARTRARMEGRPVFQSGEPS